MASFCVAQFCNSILQLENSEPLCFYVFVKIYSKLLNNHNSGVRFEREEIQKFEIRVI